MKGRLGLPTGINRVVVMGRDLCPARIGRL